MSDHQTERLRKIVKRVTQSAGEAMAAAIAWGNEAQGDPSTFTPDRRKSTVEALRFFEQLMGLAEAIEEGRHTDALIRMHSATVYQVAATIGHEAVWGHERLEELRRQGQEGGRPLSDANKQLVQRAKELRAEGLSWDQVASRIVAEGGGGGKADESVRRTLLRHKDKIEG